MSLKDAVVSLKLKFEDAFTDDAKKTEKATSDLQRSLTETAGQVAALDRAQKSANGFDALTAGVNKAEHALKVEVNTLQRLTEEMNQVGPNSQQLTKEFEKQQRKVQRLNTAFDQQTKKLSASKRALNAVGVDTKSLATESDRLGSELADAKRQMGLYQTQLATLKGKQSQAAKSMKDTSKASQTLDQSLKQTTATIGHKVVGWTAAIVSVNAIKSAFLDLVQVGDSFDQLDRKVSAAMGSVEEGEQAVAWLREFNRETPFELDQLTSSFTTLKNFGIDPMTGAMQAVVDQTAALGGGTEQLNGIVLALGQAYSKGKLQAEEMNQLIERGVPVYDLLSEATGKNASQLAEMAKEGELTRDVIDDLIRTMGEANDGEAVKAMDDIAGKISNLMDWWRSFQDQVFDSGLGDYIKAELDNVLAQLDRFSESGELERFAKRVSDSLVGTLEGVQQVAADINAVLGPALASMTTVWNSFTFVVKAAGLAVSTFVYNTMALLQQLADFTGFDQFAQRMETQVNAIGAVSQGFEQAMRQDLNDIKNAWTEGTDHVEAEAKRMNNALTPEQSEASKAYVAELQRHVDQVLGELQNSSQETSNIVTGAFDDATGKVTEFGDGVQGVASVSVAALPEVTALFDAFGQAEDAEKAVSDLAEGIEKLDSFEGALRAANQLTELRNAGQLTEEQYRSLKATADAALDSVIVKVTQATEAHKAEINQLTQKERSYQQFQQVVAQALAEEQALAVRRQATDQANQASLNAFAGMMDNLAATYRGMSEDAYQTYTDLVNYAANFGLGSTLEGYFSRLSRGLDGLNASIDVQSTRVNQLTREMQGTDVVTDIMIQRTERALSSAKYLGEEQLLPLRSALADAVNKNRQLEASAKSTVNALQDELDQINGNRKAIEERRFEQEQASLEAQLQEADGNSDAERDIRKALQLSRKLHQENLKQIRAEEQAKKKQPNTPVPLPSSSTPAVETRRIVLETPGGDSVEVFADATNEQGLLDVLQQQQRGAN